MSTAGGKKSKWIINAMSRYDDDITMQGRSNKSFFKVNISLPSQIKEENHTEGCPRVTGLGGRNHKRIFSRGMGFLSFGLTSKMAWKPSFYFIQTLNLDGHHLPLTDSLREVEWPSPGILVFISTVWFVMGTHQRMMQLLHEEWMSVNENIWLCTYVINDISIVSVIEREND